jgi:hypothetical protein
MVSLGFFVGSAGLNAMSWSMSVYAASKPLLKVAFPPLEGDILSRFRSRLISDSRRSPDLSRTGATIQLYRPVQTPADTTVPAMGRSPGTT